MKKLIKNSPQIFLVKSFRCLLFVTLAAFTGAAVRAQSINNDLQPKKAVVKTAPAHKSVTKASKPVKKSVARPIPSQTAKKSVAPAQTTAQIFDRYMNYQQSAGVSVKDWQSAAAQTGAALQSNPNDATAKAQLAVAQGQIAYARGDYSEALTQFNSAARILPASAIPYYCIGRVYLVTRQPNEAKNNFEKATKLNGGFALAYRGIGESLAAQGKSGQAREFFDQASKLGQPTIYPPQTTYAAGKNPNNVQRNVQVTPSAQLSPYEIQIRSAKSLTARKKWQESLNILLPMASSSQTPDLYLAIGDNYFGMKQWLSAQQAYQKAIGLNPNSAPALYKMGMVMFEANEYQAASDAFEKSLILDQSGATINRQAARQMADKASEKAKELKTGKKRKFLGIGFSE